MMHEVLAGPITDPVTIAAALQDRLKFTIISAALQTTAGACVANQAAEARPRPLHPPPLFAPEGSNDFFTWL